MSKINDLINMGFKINWKLIKIGYRGNDFIQPQLSKEDIYNYGYWILENSTNYSNLIPQLIGEINDDYEFNNILDKISKTEVANDSVQIRKWITFLVKEMLKALPQDYFEGILKITEFWVSLGQPDNCPHIFQGINNAITPEEYYAKEIFDMIVSNHEKWINDEVKNITLLENN